MAAVSITTAQTVTAAPTPTAARTATIASALTVTATDTQFFNQGYQLASALSVKATAKPSVYPPVEFFTVLANLTAFVVDYVDVGYEPDQQPISATVSFVPRLSDGKILWLPGQGVVLATITARFDTDGTLKTIQGDPGVELVANTPILGLDELIYDVKFTNVVYGKADQVLSPFAFGAPTTAGAVVDLSTVEKLTPKPGL